MDENVLDKIDRYLRKEMSPEESLDFEQEALNDPELLNEIEFAYNLKRSLTDRQRKLRKTLKWKYKKRRLAASMAAVVAAVSVGLWLIVVHPARNTAGENGLTAENLYAGTNMERGNNEKAISSVRKSIAEGKDKEAIETVDVMEQNKAIPTLDEISSANGFSVMSNKQDNKDADKLQKDAYELHWLKICSLVKIGNKKKALESLRIFVNIEGQHKEEADSLLKKLEK